MAYYGDPAADIRRLSCLFTAQLIDANLMPNPATYLADRIEAIIQAERSRCDARITEFAQGILHGDDEHREWLLEAAEAFNAGKDMPPPRGKGAAK